MIKVEVTAEVVYTCFLSEEDSEKVRERAKDIAEEYVGEAQDYYIDAVEELYNESEIDLYNNSVESDFNTESFDTAKEEVEE